MTATVGVELVFVQDGPGPNEKHVCIRKSDGHPCWVTVHESQVVLDGGGRPYLQVAEISRSWERHEMLVQLPREADCGAWRIFIPFHDPAHKTATLFTQFVELLEVRKETPYCRDCELDYWRCQTHEESWELKTADSAPDIAEEIGDVLSDALTSAMLLEKETNGEFTLDRILVDATEKIYRRKPWLRTGEQGPATADEEHAIWRRIKVEEQEKKKAADSYSWMEGRYINSILDDERVKTRSETIRHYVGDRIEGWTAEFTKRFGAERAARLREVYNEVVGRKDP